MTSLSKQSCEPCRSDSTPLKEEEISTLLSQIPDWERVVTDGTPRLRRSFSFEGYPPCLDFANRVGAIAEEEDHHPQLIIEWGKVTVLWWTHTINGLHRNDFILAARCDEIYQQNR
ncbi:MAG: 4a-hydroxytetrahydrobiopterin dehydratase [Porticoccaceae bacterium]|nr:4a-hydroxytetrahydrobiopterin dehydratase [Porticoccaceae bacterium]